MSKPTALQEAVSIIGGQQALAARIGVRQAHVWNWLNRDKSPVPPAEYCLPIENATGGRVTRYELRPDVFGPAPTIADAHQ